MTKKKLDEEVNETVAPGPEQKPAGEADHSAVRLTAEEVRTLCVLKTRYVAKEALTDAETSRIYDLARRPGSRTDIMVCPRCGSVTHIPVGANWPGCRFCEKKDLTVEECNKLALLLTRALMLSHEPMEPERIRLMGNLRAAAALTKVGTKHMGCPKCHKLFVEVEGMTYAGCHHCAGRMR